MQDYIKIMVDFEFDFDVDMNKAMQDVKEIANKSLFHLYLPQNIQDETDWSWDKERFYSSRNKV